MKNFVFCLSLAILSLAAFANNPGKEKVLNYRASQNLVAQFGKVSQVKWSHAKNQMFRADFIHDEEKVSAFFDSDGNYIASTRQVEIADFPKLLRKAIQARFDLATISNSLIYSSPSELAFFFEVTIGEEKTVYKTTGDANFEKFRL